MAGSVDSGAGSTNPEAAHRSTSRIWGGHYLHSIRAAYARSAPIRRPRYVQTGGSLTVGIE